MRRKQQKKKMSERRKRREKGEARRDMDKVENKLKMEMHVGRRKGKEMRR